MSNVAEQPSIVMPSAAEDLAITAAAKADPDAKQLVSVRYSPEVLGDFKSTGEGWQSRMDGVVRDYGLRQPRRT